MNPAPGLADEFLEYGKEHEVSFAHEALGVELYADDSLAFIALDHAVCRSRVYGESVGNPLHCLMVETVDLDGVYLQQ